MFYLFFSAAVPGGYTLIGHTHSKFHRKKVCRDWPENETATTSSWCLKF